MEDPDRALGGQSQVSQSVSRPPDSDGESFPTEHEEYLAPVLPLALQGEGQSLLRGGEGRGSHREEKAQEESGTQAIPVLRHGLAHFRFGTGATLRCSRARGTRNPPEGIVYSIRDDRNPISAL